MGSYQIAWYLREHKYSVQVIDFIKYLTTNQIIELLDEFVTSETKIIGLGVLGIIEQDQWLFVRFQDIMFKIRRKYPWVTIVGGGPTANRFEDEFSKGTFDWLVVGHAEDTMLSLTNHLIRGGPKPMFELTPKGTKLIRESFPVHVENKFHIQHSRHRWHERDCIQPGEALPLETTRGCIFKCKFCQYPHIGKNKRDFLRNMSEIRDELIDNYVLDDTFNADKDRIEEFWQMTKTLPFKIKYSTYLRLDLIEAHPQTAMMLQESGLVGAFFGIETFNPEAALMVGKAFSGKKAKEFLPKLMHEIWQDKISIYCGLIAGFPQETFEDLQATSQWMIDNGVHCWGWNPLYINREFGSVSEYASEFDRNAEKYGFKFQDNTNAWYTETTNFHQARDWAVSLQEIPNQIAKAGAWAIPEFLNYPSMNMDIILNKTVFEFFTEYPVYKERKEWLGRYLENLKKL
jgi:radical SAM superfamily enzyme YgiQ (UPF0313 family)